MSQPSPRFDPPPTVRKTVRCEFCGARKNRYGHISQLRVASNVWTPSKPASEVKTLPAGAWVCSHKHRSTPIATEAKGAA